MKKIRIVQTAVLVMVIAMLVSCRSGREYRDYGSYPPPQSRPSVSLVIQAGPGMTRRHPSGRYYYRAPNGYTYWRGNDSRYYLDRRHMNRGYYNHQQYNDWRRYDRRRF